MSKYLNDIIDKEVFSLIRHNIKLNTCKNISPSLYDSTWMLLGYLIADYTLSIQGKVGVNYEQRDTKGKYLYLR